MHDYQSAFLRLALHNEVLKFGSFKLKSGRQSPYFFNLGKISSGTAMRELGRAYAQALAAGGASKLSESMRDRLRERVSVSAKAVAVSFEVPAAPALEIVPARWAVPVRRPESRSARALPIRAPPVHLQKLS